MQDVDESSGENEATKTVEASLIAEGTDFVPETSVIQGSTETDSGTGVSSSCIVRVVIDAAMEEVTYHSNLGHVEAVGSFSVPEVLQQTQLVTKVYESTVDMEGIVENISESNT